MQTVVSSRIVALSLAIVTLASSPRLRASDDIPVMWEGPWTGTVSPISAVWDKWAKSYQREDSAGNELLYMHNLYTHTALRGFDDDGKVIWYNYLTRIDLPGGVHGGEFNFTAFKTGNYVGGTYYMDNSNFITASSCGFIKLTNTSGKKININSIHFYGKEMSRFRPLGTLIGKDQKVVRLVVGGISLDPVGGSIVQYITENAQMSIDSITISDATVTDGH